MKENTLTKTIIGCAIEVHKQLGPGLLESAYQNCLSYELNKIGLSIQTEKAMPIVYKEIKLNHGYRIDILVQNRIVIEVKTVEAINEIHEAQILTYLRLGGYPLGLIINFHTTMLKNGIRRFINN